MNSYRKSNTSMLMSRRESVELLPSNFNADLLALQLTNNKKEVVNEYVVKRKEELLQEMKQQELNIAYDKATDIPKLNSLLAEIKYRNEQMKLKLKQQDQITTTISITESNEKSIELTNINNEIEKEQEQNKALIHQIEELGQTLRKKQKSNNILQDDFNIYEEKQPKIQLKEFMNQQALKLTIKQNTNIKVALQDEKQWQQEQINQILGKYEKKNNLVKENLEELCEQEEKIEQLKLELLDTQKQIDEINRDIHTKFNKIEKCAEFLDELDDFDKLFLIFVMEQPDEFELSEILENARFQLSKPKNRMQIADSEQEYIDRARFSSVSSRMKIFLKFHNNNLNKSVDNLVLVHQSLQFQEMTLKNRYEDLLQQKKKLIHNLDELNQLQFYPEDDILFERHDQHINVEELNVEQAQATKNQQTRLVEGNAQFIIRVYSTLTNTLSRMINSLINIKEILKTCPSEQFDQDFYLKWTYNRIYQKLSQITQELEQKYKIKIVAKDPQVRNSNQLINAIYDHLEEKPARKKTLAPLAPKPTMHEILDNFSIGEQKIVQDSILEDIILNKFFTISDLQNIICLYHENLTEEQLITFIKTEGYQMALQNASKQLKQLLNIIEQAYLDCKTISIQPHQAKIIIEKYKLKDLMEKHINTYEYKPKDWRKELFQSKITQLKQINGQPIEEQIITPQIESQINKTQNTLILTPKIPSIETFRKCKTEQSPNLIKRFMVSLDSSIPSCQKSQINQLQLDPLFINLHNQSRKIKNFQRSQTQSKLIQPPHQTFEALFSKKSIELSRDSMTNLQLKSSPIQQNIIYRTNSKCPKILNTQSSRSTYTMTNRSKCLTKTSVDYKQEAPLSSTHSQISTVYGNTNKKLQDFFHMTSLRRK